MSFMMVMFPFWMCMGSVIEGRDESSVEDIVMECALLLPVSVVYFSILLHPIRLSKMHYLCPMTRQQRIMRRGRGKHADKNFTAGNACDL
jgi:hypothetical protein